MRSFGLLLLALPALCLAQPVQEFPSDATAPSAKEVTEHVSGKNFRWKTATGATVRVRFTERGSLYASAPGGNQDSGEWRAEDGRLCGTLRSVGAFCNDVRMSGGFMHLRRTNGEVVRYEPD